MMGIVDGREEPPRTPAAWLRWSLRPRQLLPNVVLPVALGTALHHATGLHRLVAIPLGFAISYAGLSLYRRLRRRGS